MAQNPGKDYGLGVRLLVFQVIILVILETQKSYLKCRKHLACAIKG